MIGAAGVQETLQQRREELVARADRARDDAAHRGEAVKALLQFVADVL